MHTMESNIDRHIERHEKEDVMKRSTCTNALALLLGTAAPALAASGAREDNSGIFAWIFLGFCALIVVAQVLPALLVMLGFAKGLKKAPAEATEKATH